MMDELGIPIEAQMNTAIYDEAPDIAAHPRQRGDEIVSSPGLSELNLSVTIKNTSTGAKRD